MASEYLQDLAFQQLSHAIMATANSVAGANNNAAAPSESSIFDVMRRKLGKVQDVIQGIAAPLKRRSMYEELPEHVWPQPEQIEMSHMVLPGHGIGHVFVPCQLSNPTWCDFCGDFIWGLYKQCLRCNTCQYTCHQHCKPLVSLNCKSVSEDGIDISGSTPGAASPPTGPPGSRPPLESSMSLDSMRVRPGVARNINNSSPIAGVTSPHISTNTHTRGGSPVTVGRQSPAGHARLGRSASDGHVVVPPQALASVPGRPVAVVDPVLLDSPLHRPQHIPHPSSTQTAASSSPLHHIQQQQQQEILDPRLLPPPPSAQCSDSWRPPVISEEVVSGSSVSSSTSQGGEVHTAGTTDSQLPIDRHIDLHPDLPTEKDETDSGYRSGTIPDEKLPKVPSQATLDRQELKRKVAKFNHFVPAAALEVTGKESFQGFLKVTMNLIRPITMELGARPPSIYELLTREHIIEENTQQVAFYMPRDTHKSLHIDSETTTKEVISSLLKKFHILDHPRKFAMYEQEFNDKNKLVRLRRLTDKDYPLLTLITWDPERIRNYRMVLQENETGEIVWDAFSLPELNNFLKVLDREEKEMIHELRHKYVYMRQVMEKRLVELKNQRRLSSKSKA